MIALLKQIPSEAKIRQQLKLIIFGKHIFCPVCQTRQIIKAGKRYYCKKCRRSFSLLSGTWLANMKISLRTFWALLWCWTQQVPVLQSQKLCHVSEETVYHWFRQFRLHLPQFEPILQGTVQMDEAYFKNISLLMAKQIGTRNLAHQIIFKNSVNRGEVANFLFQHIQPKTNLHTDGSGIYRGINNWWQVKHRKDIHKKFEFRLTSEIEGLFGNLRTFIRRMYHHATPQYLPEYVGEFSLRFCQPQMFTSPLTYLQYSLSSAPLD